MVRAVFLAKKSIQRPWSSWMTKSQECFIPKRTHMNHGGNPSNPAFSGSVAMNDGPRSSNVPLGLEATKHSGNILRLLESSHYQYGSQQLSSSVWHLKKGQYWMYDNNDSQKGGWKAFAPDEPLPTIVDNNNKLSGSKNSNALSTVPKLESISFADECTALVKLIGTDGNARYLSLLKLMDDDSMAKRESMGGPPFLANDGWMIVREVVAPSNSSNDNGTLPSSSSSFSTNALTQLIETIQTYWSIEHGGGPKDRSRAEQLFHPDATLLSVGMTDESEYDHHNPWTAPVGSLLEIPLETYLDGVESQTPHAPECSKHDTVMTLDLSGGSAKNEKNGAAATAAVTLTVGNGGQSLLFTDHLLLGRSNNNDTDTSDGKSASWKILSKLFSPQPWPKY